MRRTYAHLGGFLLGPALLAACFDSSASGTAAPAVLDGGSADDGGASDAAPAPQILIDAGPGCNAPPAQSAISPAEAGVPGDGLVLWLRADRGVYTGTVDAGAGDKVAGPPVCAWVDQSGSGWALENLTGTQPTLVASGVGLQPAVHFTGVDEALQTSGVLGISASSPRTFVAVEELVSGGGRFEPIVQGATGSAGAYIAIDANTWETAGNREGVYMTSNSYDTATTTTTTAARVHVYTVTSMALGAAIIPAVDYWVNGVTQTLTHLPGGDTGTFEDFSTANFTAVGDSFTSSTGVTPDGLVAEVLVYDRALSLAERTTVEHALEGRYGIQ